MRKVKIKAKHFINKVEPELTNLVEDAEDLEEIVESIIGLGKLKEKPNGLQINCDKFDTCENNISEYKGQRQKSKALKQAAIRIEK